jgi:hypothetical protein
VGVTEAANLMAKLTFKEAREMALKVSKDFDVALVKDRLAEAQKAIDELEEARKVDPKSLDQPMTI